MTRAGQSEKTQIEPQTDRKGWHYVNHLPMNGEAALEDSFHSILALEHRRAERSGSPFVLMLLSSRKPSGGDSALTRQLTPILSDVIRETDLIGWYRQGVILGVIFTEVGLSEKGPVTSILYSRVTKALRESLDRKLASSLVVTLRAFPESSKNGCSDAIVNVPLCPEVSEHRSPKAYPDIRTAVDPA